MDSIELKEGLTKLLPSGIGVAISASEVVISKEEQDSAGKIIGLVYATFPYDGKVVVLAYWKEDDHYVGYQVFTSEEALAQFKEADVKMLASDIGIVKAGYEAGVK